MDLLDAIDKLLEPITKRIFATKFGKSIRPMTGEELYPSTSDEPGYAFESGNIWHLSRNENESSCLNDD